MLGKEVSLNIISELEESYHKATVGKCGFANLAFFFTLPLRAASAGTGYLPYPGKAFCDDEICNPP